MTTKRHAHSTIHACTSCDPPQKQSRATTAHRTYWRGPRLINIWLRPQEYKTTTKAPAPQPVSHADTIHRHGIELAIELLRPGRSAHICSAHVSIWLGGGARTRGWPATMIEMWGRWMRYIGDHDDRRAGHQLASCPPGFGPVKDTDASCALRGSVAAALASRLRRTTAAKLAGPGLSSCVGAGVTRRPAGYGGYLFSPTWICLRATAVLYDSDHCSSIGGLRRRSTSALRLRENLGTWKATFVSLA
jgi:hypothetical protein